ncbi:hypothetical protein HY492_03545 [Candidatus Woesearchaeota archaeon]|nr:hypothetical protein [Candidatus Woesearchaeota archaeon]
MYELMSEKDIIAFNQAFDKGTVINKSSLSFAVEEANHTKSWLRGCAVLVRAILIDHVFEEGNKRTAASVIGAYLDEQGLLYNEEAIPKAVTKILMKNMTNIRTIERVINDVII